MQATDANKLVFAMSFLNPKDLTAVKDAIEVRARTLDEKIAIVLGFLSPRARIAVRRSSYIA